ncbi:MAG: hypothetical protein NT008_07225 [Methylococcales bacterium]|nr:hypothetical protein [Methylococcales bacterium]
MTAEATQTLNSAKQVLPNTSVGFAKCYAKAVEALPLLLSTQQEWQSTLHDQRNA